MEKIILSFLFLCFFSNIAFAKAYFADKEKMILKSDFIAIVNITNVIFIETDKQYRNQEANASVNKILKGNTENNITFFVPCFFPCAVASVKKGPYIVFLKHEKNKLSGVNWGLSYRPIKNNKVEWYSNEDTLKLEEKDFVEVIEDITEVIEKQKNRNNLAAEERIDRTTGRSDVCELHKVHMQKVKVTIVYGLPPASDEEERKYFDAKKEFFPNANLGKVEGGCMPSLQKKTNIYVCPRCEKERKSWLKTTGATEPHRYRPPQK